MRFALFPHDGDGAAIYCDIFFFLPRLTMPVEKTLAVHTQKKLKICRPTLVELHTGNAAAVAAASSPALSTRHH